MTSQLPHDFNCPISLEIMTDPVIISSGHTFDRSSIQRWIDSGQRTCPITKQPFPPHSPLIPNHALRSLISNSTPLTPCPQPPPPQPQAPLSVVTSKSSSLCSKLDSLTQLVKSTKHDSLLRRELAEYGAVFTVLKCVDSPELGEKALSLLLNLSLDDDNKVGLVAEGAIERVLAVLRNGLSPDCRAIGCTLLTSLAVVEVNKATIGSYPDAIDALIGLLKNGKGREVKEAATTLYAICSYPENRRRVVERGAVSILVKVGSTGMERAVEVLSLLVRCKEGKEEMVGVSGCVEMLMNVVRNGSGRGVQCALFTLNSLCGYSDKVSRKVIGDGILKICVGLVDDKNEKIRRNASSLVEILLSYRLGKLVKLEPSGSLVS